MRKLSVKILVFSICFGFLLCANHAFASGSWDSCEGFKGKLLNACHKVDYDKRKAPRGVGADILIHETEQADLVAEYKYDGENEEHSIFAVVKTKKSLTDYVKDLIAKVKGE